MEPRLSGIERAVFGPGTWPDVAGWLDRFCRDVIGSAVEEVVLRSGRVSAVLGARLRDDRTVVVKVFRAGTSVPALRAAQECQRRLARSGFPCPVPVEAARSFEGRVATAEHALPGGRRGDGHRPSIRDSLAGALAAQIELLHGGPSVGDRLTPPAWARWRQGPWPRAHDPLFDLQRPDPRWRGVDALGAAASAQLHGLRGRLGPRIVAHADWTCGNTVFGPADELVGSYDWDGLASDAEAILVGMAAGSHPQGGAGAPCPAPAEIGRFVEAYERARGRSFERAERLAARLAACWVLAYGARCEGALLDPDDRPPSGSVLDVLQQDGEQYLAG